MTSTRSVAVGLALTAVAAVIVEVVLVLAYAAQTSAATDSVSAARRQCVLVERGALAVEQRRFDLVDLVVVQLNHGPDADARVVTDYVNALEAAAAGSHFAVQKVDEEHRGVVAALDARISERLEASRRSASVLLWIAVGFGILVAAGVAVSWRTAIANVLAADLARRRRVELERKQLQALFTGNPLAVAFYRRDGTIVTGNQAALDLLGYRPEDLAGKPYAVHLMSSEIENATARLARVVDGEPVSFETVFRHADGYGIPVDAALCPVVVGGELVGIYGIARDLRPALEREFRLTASEARLRSVINHAETPVALIGLDERFREVNSAFAQFCALPPEQLVGTAYRKLLTSTDVPEATAWFLDASATARPRAFRATLVRGDGGRQEVVMRLVPSVVDGTTESIWLVMRDAAVPAPTEAV